MESVQMNDGLKYFIFLAFAMMVLQSFLSYLQYKSYQKAVSALQGKGWILGIGMRKGGFHIKGGAIVVLAWNPEIPIHSTSPISTATQELHP